MNEPKKPDPPRAIQPPIWVEWNDDDYPPETIVPMPLEDQFRDKPTERILHLLDLGFLNPEARAIALAELARRGVPPPPA